MDLLQHIKQDHEALRTLLKAILTEPNVTSRRRLALALEQQMFIHLKLESDYLYPEVQNLFKRSQIFIENSLKNHKNLIRKLKSLIKNVQARPALAKDEIDQEIEKLFTTLDDHLRFEEEELMPQIRERISTQEREDLGFAFLDAARDLAV
jgi:hypothetical protein